MGKREFHHEHEDHLNADLNHVRRTDNTGSWHQLHVPTLPGNLPGKGGGSGIAKKNRVVTGRNSMNSGRLVAPGMHNPIGGNRSGRLKQAGKMLQGPLTPGGRPMHNKAAHHLEESRSQLDLIRVKQRQADSKVLRQSQSHEFKKGIPDYLQSLIDIDGDGHVDSEEFSLMKELENVSAFDLDGDGQIDEHEILLAKQLAGKKLLAKKFVDRQKGKMWRYAKEFNDKSEDQMIDTIVHAKDYQGLMNHLKLKEKVMRLSSSDQIKSAFETPATNRAMTGRNRIFKQQYFGLR